MSTPVEQIKERLGIADVVGSYLKLERAGSSLKAKCPFHNEKTPSFFVSPARGSYYCFGCNKGGDIFSFVQEFEGLDFVGALRILAQRAGVELHRVDPKVRSEYARLYLLLEKATRFFEGVLARSAEAREYLEKRGLKPETVSSWRLGFAPNEWRLLFEHLLNEGFKPDEMERVGLIKRAGHPSADVAVKPLASGTPEIATSADKHAIGASSTSAVRHYDTFRGRIMFPITDSAGRVVGFSGRILPSADVKQRVPPSSAEVAISAGTNAAGVVATSALGRSTSASGRMSQTPDNLGIVYAKYINSPETILYNKSRVLYGFDKAKLAIRSRDAAILVEGQMDLLMVHQAGHTYAVAVSGTALTREHLALLKRMTNNLLLCFDADSAGVRASERAIRLALNEGFAVKVIALRGGKDPAELIAGDPAAWESAVSGATHVIEFLTEELLRSGVSAREQALRTESAILPLIALLQSPVEQSHFLKYLGEKTGLREESLWQAFRKVQKTAPTSAGEPAAYAVTARSTVSAQAGRADAIARKIWSLIFWGEERGKEGGIDAEAARARLLAILGAARFAESETALASDRAALLFEGEAFALAGAPAREMEELLRNLEEEILTISLSNAMERLHRAERGGKPEEVASLLSECKELSDKLTILKSARFSPQFFQQ